MVTDPAERGNILEIARRWEKETENAVPTNCTSRNDKEIHDIAELLILTNDQLGFERWCKEMITDEACKSALKLVSYQILHKAIDEIIGNSFTELCKKRQWHWTINDPPEQIKDREFFLAMVNISPDKNAPFYRPLVLKKRICKSGQGDIHNEYWAPGMSYDLKDIERWQLLELPEESKCDE